MTVIFKLQEGIFKQCSLQSVLDMSIAPSPVDDPIINQLKIPKITGNSCNVLVLILDANRSADHLFLWNPPTRTFKILPQVDEIGHQWIANHGVGWDESSDDYKMFSFFYIQKSQEYIEKVCSSKMNSWKTIEHMQLSLKNPSSIVSKVDGQLHFLLERQEGMFVGGKLHWKKLGREEPIVCFDLKTEVFGKIELPFKAEPCYSYSMMGAIGGCLSLVRVYKGSPTVEVWVMKEYGVKESWSKLVVLSNVQELVQCPFSAPFVAGEDC